MQEPSASQRSREEQDLLECSTKKPKQVHSPSITRLPSISMKAVRESSTNDDASFMTPPSGGASSASFNCMMNERTEDQGLKNDREGTSTAYDDMQEDDGDDPYCPTIKVTEEEKIRLRKPWQRTLIIRVLGRTVGFMYLHKRLHAMWRPEGQMELIPLDQDYYLVRFEVQRDYDYAKFEGPWMLLNHYVTVKEWVPNFYPTDDITEKLLVWIHFPNLPAEYFEEEFLMKIGRKVGRPIKIDTTTSLVSKGKFARLCVEVDITKRLLSKYDLEGKARSIEYEGIHLICFKCGLYGHRREQCGRRSGESIGKEENHEVHEDDRSNCRGQDGTPLVFKETVKIPSLNDNFGEWMIVSKKDRRKPRRNNQGDNTRQVTGRNTTPKPPGRTNVQKNGTSQRFAPLEDHTDRDQPFDGASNVSFNEHPGGQRASSSKGKEVITSPRQVASHPTLGEDFMFDDSDFPQLAVSSSKDTTRGRGHRGGHPGNFSRRAVAESEHTLVRGSGRGQTISRTTVQHDDPLLAPVFLNDINLPNRKKPPDKDNALHACPSQPDEAMELDGNMSSSHGCEPSDPQLF
ncbi:PREDICTED: uncharacterized protein LOC109164046 [Ipomoea nil]|uniref:uncharacterized protein LOC109164046 n=1 Tax=Ipomoea nil TaxID=35883 RepID=UPI000900E59E|nr:PREDICTED: uncharacterized protein LOC109164046 [Ipomoea nil]